MFVNSFGKKFVREGERFFILLQVCNYRAYLGDYRFLRFMHL